MSSSANSANMASGENRSTTVPLDRINYPKWRRRFLAELALLNADDIATGDETEPTLHIPPGTSATREAKLRDQFAENLRSFHKRRKAGFGFLHRCLTTDSINEAYLDGIAHGDLRNGFRLLDERINANRPLNRFQVIVKLFDLFQKNDDIRTFVHTVNETFEQIRIVAQVDLPDSFKIAAVQRGVNPQLICCRRPIALYFKC